MMLQYANLAVSGVPQAALGQWCLPDMSGTVLMFTLIHVRTTRNNCCREVKLRRDLGSDPRSAGRASA